MKGASRIDGSVGIIVLGMHRSGTSATARLLGELGCDYGGELLAGREDNPDGYFEHREVVEIHNEFLRRLGRAWDDPRSWRDEFEGTAAAAARDRLAEVFAQDFAGRRLWVLKDPRLCRLMPLWKGIFDRADVRFAVVHRHPWAVARSLSRRDDLLLSHALLLWLRHVLEAEQSTRGRIRCYLRFETLMADPDEVLPSVLARLNVTGFTSPLWTAAERALEPARVHHRADDEDKKTLRQLFPWVERCHRTLGQLDLAPGDGPPSASAVLDRARDELQAVDRLFDGGFMARLVSRLHDCDSDRQALRAVARERDRYVASLESSLAEKDRHAAALEKGLEDARLESKRYVDSLKEALEAKDHHAEVLLARIQTLEKRLAS